MAPHLLEEPLEQGVPWIERKALSGIASDQTGQGAGGQPHTLQNGRKGEPGRKRAIRAGPVIQQGQRADQGRGLAPSFRRIEGEGQIFAPMSVAALREGRKPAIIGTERIAGRHGHGATGQTDGALMGNNVDFFQRELLESQCGGIAGPTGPQAPGGGEGTGGNTGV
jgi:hypothetical protein